MRNTHPFLTATHLRLLGAAGQLGLGITQPQLHSPQLCGHAAVGKKDSINVQAKTKLNGML